jgi:hypothetical protein
VVRSTKERSARAPNCWPPTMCKVMAIHEIFRATSLSRPFLITESRAIGLYERGEVRSALFSLGIIASIAVWKHRGWCPWSRQCWKRLRICGSISVHASCRILVGISSRPGAVFPAFRIELRMS